MNVCLSSQHTVGNLLCTRSDPLISFAQKITITLSNGAAHPLRIGSGCSLSRGSRRFQTIDRAKRWSAAFFPAADITAHKSCFILLIFKMIVCLALRYRDSGISVPRGSKSVFMLRRTQALQSANSWEPREQFGRTTLSGRTSGALCIGGVLRLRQHSASGPARRFASTLSHRSSPWNHWGCGFE